MKYVENIGLSGVTTGCKISDSDATDYKSINEDFQEANKSPNGKNFKTQQINQINAQNIENGNIKYSRIIPYNNTIIGNLVALAKDGEMSTLGKYNTGLKFINEIFMLLAQYKFYKELQEEKKKNNSLNLVDSYKLNVSESVLNKYGSTFSVNNSEILNSMPRVKESMTESYSVLNNSSNNNYNNNNKQRNMEEESITLNKVIVKMKTSYFLGTINGIGNILNIIISENIITGEYTISHHLGHSFQLSTQPILLSEFNPRDNILFLPIYNELKEPYIMAWSMPQFNVEWICKLSVLSNIENQKMVINVASDDMIYEDKLKQYVKTKNSNPSLGILSL